MKRPAIPRHEHAVRVLSLAGAFAISAAVIGGVVGAFQPVGHDPSFAAATEVAITPARVEVIGARAPRSIGAVARPHVG